ncbi:MAG: DUF370 domain-containing protein [Negativicutes bacterium]|nr:DUF370 domain-containing protein [Negativicutes bacterium]
MFLHLGDNWQVAAEKIVAIVKYDPKRQTVNKKIVEVAQQDGKMVNIAPEKVKTMVVADGMIYLSGIAPLTLMRRSTVKIDSPGIR